MLNVPAARIYIYMRWQRTIYKYYNLTILQSSGYVFVNGHYVKINSKARDSFSV